METGFNPKHSVYLSRWTLLGLVTYHMQAIVRTPKRILLNLDKFASAPQLRLRVMPLLKPFITRRLSWAAYFFSPVVTRLRSRFVMSEGSRSFTLQNSSGELRSGGKEKIVMPPEMWSPPDPQPCPLERLDEDYDGGWDAWMTVIAT